MSGALLTQPQVKVLASVNKLAGLQGAVDVKVIGKDWPSEEWVIVGPSLGVLLKRGYVNSVDRWPVDSWGPVVGSVCITEKGRQYLRMTSNVSHVDVDVLLAVMTVTKMDETSHPGYAGVQEVERYVGLGIGDVRERLEVLGANDYIVWKDKLGYTLTQRGVEFIQWYDEQAQAAFKHFLGPGPHVILSQAERTPTISGPMVDYLELALLRWKFGTPDQQERKANDLAQEMTREVIRQWEQP